MSCLGVLFSLSPQQAEALRSQPDDAARLEYVRENLEEHYLSNDPERAAELAVAWDAIHRVMTDGTLTDNNGRYPYSHVILGGEQLYQGANYIMVLKTPAEVTDIADAIQNIDEAGFRSLYKTLDPADYFHASDDDFELTWEYFQDAKPFWERAASENRYVLFTADQ